MNDEEYKELQKKIEESNRKDEARTRAIRKKRAEKQAIKNAGGGHAVAKAIMSHSDTDFDYGANVIDPVQQVTEELTDRCMGSVRCKRCRKFHGYCAEVQEKIMLPIGDETPRSTGKKTGGLDWLKNDDLSKTPKEAKILMVRPDLENKFGPRVTLKMAFDGKIKFWGIPIKRDKSPNYRLLLERFGPEENDWIDQRILIFLEQDEFSGAWFPRVDFPKKAGNK